MSENQNEIYGAVDDMDEDHVQGLHTHVQSLIAYGNFHRQFYGWFAEWLYESDHTNAQILQNVSTLVYLAIVDGTALYRALGKTARQSQNNDADIDIDGAKAQEIHNNIIEFPKAYPELHKQMTDEVLTNFGFSGDISMFKQMDESSWEWYTMNTEKRKSDGD